MTTYNEQVLGQRIKQMREKRGMEQNELANLADLNLSTLHRIESGVVKQPGPGVLFQLANSLSTTIDYLVGRVNSDVVDSIPTGDKIVRYFLTKYPKLRGAQRARLVVYLRSLETEEEDDPAIRDLLIYSKRFVSTNTLRARKALAKRNKNRGMT